MADSKLSALTALAGSGLASTDEFYINDTGTGSKRITAAELLIGLLNTVKVNTHVLFATDNTNDIGAPGATRPRNVYIAGTLTPAGLVTVTASTGIYFSSYGSLKSGVTDGIFSFVNNAQTGFGSLLFGPSGTTYTRLKHGGTALLQGRLANDADFASFQAKIRTHANAVAETPTATHTIAIEDAAGTAYKVLCVAA